MHETRGGSSETLVQGEKQPEPPLVALDASLLVLRQDKPPVDQRDYEDRHDTRATHDDNALRRYLELDRQRTRRDWHRTFQRLVTVTIGAILYVAAVVALRHLLPDLTVYQDMVIAGAALGAPYAGNALRLGAETVRERYGRPRGPGDERPT